MTEIGEPVTSKHTCARQSSYKIIDDVTGEPITNARVVLLDPSGRETVRHSDAQGLVHLPSTVDGDWLLIHIAEFFLASEDSSHG